MLQQFLQMINYSNNPVANEEGPSLCGPLITSTGLLLLFYAYSRRPEEGFFGPADVRVEPREEKSKSPKIKKE